MNDAEKIYANDKVAAQRIREENEKRKLEGYSQERRDEKASCAQMDARSTERDRSTNTREQRAKMSGVSSGTTYNIGRNTFKLNTDIKKKLPAMKLVALILGINILFRKPLNKFLIFVPESSFKWNMQIAKIRR